MRFFLNLIALTLVAAWAGAAPVAAIKYNRDIQPILAENCFACHGADSASRKAGLRLDHFENATNVLASGVAAIVPGRPNDSELVRRINLSDDDQMPPAEVNKILTPKQRELLTKWISTGAKYEPHWSFIAPQKLSPPQVKDKKWVRTPVDNFILARLEQEKLKPNSEADKRTLIRRVTLDLTGLPPTAKEVEAFLADSAPDAYEKVVDRLLASTRWGEHRTRYWLDVARYGDTHGIHFDNYREMWSYRDWVINAFNRNLPFDQFTIESLAGDLLPNATRDQKIASGFNRCNITSNEGGLIDEEYLMLYTRDRTETTSQAFLGLTAGCAVCHDHKYDPLSQKEFYSLSAFFNNTTQGARDGNIKDTPPVIVVPAPDDQERWEQLDEDRTSTDNNIAARKTSGRGDFTNWLAKPDFSSVAFKPVEEKAYFHAPLDEGQGTEIHYRLGGSNAVASILANTNWQAGAIAASAYTVAETNAPSFPGVGNFDRKDAFSVALWLRPDEHDRSGTIVGCIGGDDSKNRGWEVSLAEGKLVFSLISEWPKKALRVVSREELPWDRWVHLGVVYEGTSKARGVKLYINGKLAANEIDKNELDGAVKATVPLKIGQREKGSVLAGAGVQDVKLFKRKLPAEEIAHLMNIPRLRWLAEKSGDKRSEKETEEMYSLWLLQADPIYLGLLKTREDLKTEEANIRKRGTVAHVMNERDSAAEAFLLFRGEYDKKRDRVTPDTPAFLPAIAPELPRNRLGFARWLLQPDNPLPARVTVNRFWQELFGTGLVKTSGDFGVAGEPPSHPELLDWLAVDFREHNWDVKRIYKLMVMSAAYRQSGVVSPEKVRRDPENRLLARGPRFRMDAEMVRDYALATSGLLVERIGGPSTRPYQPPNIWEIVGMPQGDTRKYVQDKGEGLYRRSVYTFWKRQAHPPSMEIFNAPSRESCTMRRERSNTPLQALVTLNDPQFVEAARNLAQAGLQQDKDVYDFMAMRLLARPLTSPERKIVEAGARDLLAHYQAAPKEAEKLLAVGDSKPDPQIDPRKLAAYTMLANQLLNLDEVLTK